MSIEFQVPDMTCGHCVKTITGAVTAAVPARRWSRTWRRTA